jgi:hypothetical protein
MSPNLVSVGESRELRELQTQPLCFVLQSLGVPVRKESDAS